MAIDIYSILQTRPHNLHHLKRYWKFIQSCKIANKSFVPSILGRGSRLRKGICLEIHHILPKAKDLFPEYRDLKDNHWNGIYLTPRQHIIAHVMLWKSFGDSQANALHYMFQRKVYSIKLIKVEANARIDMIKHNSVKMKNKSRYALPSGEFYAVLDKDDPQVKELNLIPYQTEAHKAQQRRRVQLATAAKLGTKTYNNGLVEIKRREHPGEGWILGRLPRSQAHLEAQRLGLKKARAGKVCWNDGIKNYYLHPTEIPLAGWVRGMAPQKPRRNQLI
jgi:hypothetical protein